MITNSEIIPSESAISALKEEVLDGLEIKETEVEARFNASEHGQFYLAFIVLIIVFLILKNTVFKPKNESVVSLTLNYLRI